jgi:hypothetical protein
VTLSTDVTLSLADRLQLAQVFHLKTAAVEKLWVRPLQPAPLAHNVGDARRACVCVYVNDMDLHERAQPSSSSGVGVALLLTGTQAIQTKRPEKRRTCAITLPTAASLQA